MVVGIIGWIVLGLITGLAASKLANKHGEGLSLDILLGIVGAVIGGWQSVIPTDPPTARAGGVTARSGPDEQGRRDRQAEEGEERTVQP